MSEVIQRHDCCYFYSVPSASVVLKSSFPNTTAVYTYLSGIKMAELHSPNKRGINMSNLTIIVYERIS